MVRYGAFLRGVNLGSKRRVSGDQLRSLFVELGFRDVDAFRTSGNVVFEADRESAAKLTTRIEAGLAGSLGYEVTAFLRSAGQVKAIADHEPFAAELVTSSKGKLQVSLLARKPTAGSRRRVLALAGEDDRLAFGDRELYWLPSGGTRDAALDIKTIEELLGTSTMRTKGTIEQIAAKYFAD